MNINRLNFKYEPTDINLNYHQVNQYSEKRSGNGEIYTVYPIRIMLTDNENCGN